MLIAKVVFWLSATVIVYTYLGYPLIIGLLARWRPRPIKGQDITPPVTLLIAAYNEQDCIAAKLENSLNLDYPGERLEIVVVADGSTDRTTEIVTAHAESNVRLLYQAQRQGKVGALIRAFPLTHGEIVVFSDANCYFPADTLRKLVRHFADLQVGGASGAKRIIQGRKTISGHGESIYWRYESFLKACDSAVSSVMGVPGEVWAARRDAYIAPDPDTLLDDFVASMTMVIAGWRVIFDPEVQAYEEASPSLRAEWRRRARNAAGGWQAFFKLRGMLVHRSRLVIFQYLSHRVLRWMVTPQLFVLLFLSNLYLLSSSFYGLAFGVQVGFYGLALGGWVLATLGEPVSWLLAPLYVCLLNAAAVVGGCRYLLGKQSVLWHKVR